MRPWNERERYHLRIKYFHRQQALISSNLYIAIKHTEFIKLTCSMHC
jgi:hypothetical protein